MWEKLDNTARIEKLRGIISKECGSDGKTELPPQTKEVNNHVHTSYSFSPYTPSEVALKARESGLMAVGIMDHDSVSGAQEFVEACAVAGVASTVGFELRVNADATAIEGRKINNPDTKNIFYMAVHGIPHTQIEAADGFLRPIRKERGHRNRRQVEALADILRAKKLPTLDYDRDVVPESMAQEGGSVTERHILSALAKLLEAQWGRGEGLVRQLESVFGITLNERVGGYLSDTHNPHYLYDLLGVLKSNLLPQFYIGPNKDECINVKDVIAFTDSIGAIPAYAYLGDVADSPTGDKKAAKFEDDYLDELVKTLGELGFKAVTYMPPRNTTAQLDRIMRLCEAHNLMQISGVDINSSRQTFNCSEIMDPKFGHLIDATWALVAHERLSDKNRSNGLFSAGFRDSDQGLEARIREYAVIGRSMYEK